MHSRISTLLRKFGVGAHGVRLAVRSILVQTAQGGQRLLSLHFHHAAGEQHLCSHGGNQQPFLRLIHHVACPHLAEALQMALLICKDLRNPAAHLVILGQQQRTLIHADRAPFHLRCNAQCLAFILHNHHSHLFHSLST